MDHGVDRKPKTTSS